MRAAGSARPAAPAGRLFASADPWSLPQPRHLVAAGSESAHYHFGHFVSSLDSLQLAMHRMSASCAVHLRPGSRVLDVGSGIGGTARMLARLGHQVTGLEACADSVRFAQLAHAVQAGLRFEHGRFPHFATRQRVARGELPAFDALVFLEVLQHFDDLDEVLHAARSLLVPGGRIVIADVFSLSSRSRDQVPYHRDGAVLEAARRNEFELAARRSLTRRVRPTPLQLLRSAQSRCELNAAQRPGLHADLDELAQHCRALHAALSNGDLIYEILVLRCP